MEAEAGDKPTPQAITVAEAETVEDIFGNDVEHVKMVEEPPDPGIQLITDPHQDGDMTTAELAGEQVPVLQQPPPEAGGDYCHGPHQAVGQANTDVEYMEINKWDTVEKKLWRPTQRRRLWKRWIHLKMMSSMPTRTRSHQIQVFVLPLQS